MNPLLRHFEENRSERIHKWMHYFDIYTKHFAKFIGHSPIVIEIGVGGGGSLKMWREYFGEGARIYGLDINEKALAYAQDSIEVVIGDQANVGDLLRLLDVSGPPHIIIDDGGHHAHQQNIAFEVLFPELVDGGVYLIEDTHTSYWEEFGGGYLRNGTIVERAKDLIDDLHGWHQRKDGKGLSMHSQTIRCLSCYDSVLVIDKERISRPFARATGNLHGKQG